jgi:hypothetical protein
VKVVKADFTAYSDEQWNNIKAYLARFGVDADAGTLRAELERLAARYVEHSRLGSPTQRQLEKSRMDICDKVGAARRMFEPRQTVRFFLSPNKTYKSGDKIADEAHRVLSVIEKQLQGAAPNFYDVSDYVAGNAEQEARNGYVIKLLKIRKRLIGNKYNHARAGWLRVCTAPFNNFNAKKIDYLLHHGLPRFS